MLSEVLPNEPRLLRHSSASSDTSSTSSLKSHGRAVQVQQQDDGKAPAKDGVDKAPASPVVAGPNVQQPAPLPPSPIKGPVGKDGVGQQGAVPACNVSGDDTVQFGESNVAINDIYISNHLASAMETAMEPGWVPNLKTRKAFKKVCKHIIKNPPEQDLSTLLNSLRLNHTGPACSTEESNVLDAPTAVKVAGVQQRAAATVVRTSGRVLTRWAEAVVSSTKNIKVKHRQSARILIDTTSQFVAEAVGDKNLTKSQQTSLENSRDSLRDARGSLV